MMKFLLKIRSHFFTGFFAVLPLGLTAYVLYYLVIKGNTLIVSITPAQYYDYVTDQHFWWLWRGLILIISILLFSLIGVLTKIYVGRRLFRVSEQLLNTIPIVSKIYSAIKQVSSAVFGQQSDFFKKVVLFQYPLKGTYAIAFFTGYASKDVSGEEETWINLFVPTTPNPTSGFYLMVPEENVRYLDMTIEDAMKLIISGGAVVPKK